jgi:galactokinase
MIDHAWFAGLAPIVQASAPGRVNLLGEHTDYNDGFVLPIATPMRTFVTVAPSNDGLFHFASTNLDEQVELDHHHRVGDGFGRYLEGCIRVLERRAVRVPPLRLLVSSSVPIGAGLSSSAALEVAALRAIRSLLGIALGDVELALAAQEAEVAYAGVHCGLMDQLASSLCDENHMLLIDTRNLDTTLLPLPGNAELIVIDSGVARTLANSAYNARRRECQQAAALLGVHSLREVRDAAAAERLPPPLCKRARHVVKENARVLQAASGVDAATFGQLMNESHFSLRDDYEVSAGALDTLTELLRAHDAVFGARLTGAGFGGACVALCEQGAGSAVGAQVVEQFNRQGGRAALLMPAAPS